MKNLEVVSYKQRLDYLFTQVSTLNNDPEMQAHWARYLCVLTSGLIETAMHAIYGKYTIQRSHVNVANYVSSRLARIYNPNMEDILNLAGGFNQHWRKTLEAAITEELKDSVDSTIANRNSIAHGKNVGISYVTMKKYYENVIKVLEIIENSCD
jgi:hypothetical protein